MDTELAHQPMIDALRSVEKLISYLLSSSEEEISEGESMFDTMKEQDPNSLALHLSQLVGASNSHDIDFQEKCADLLYKLLTNDKCYFWNNNVSVPAKSTIKSILLVRIKVEESKPITLKLCDIVSELCNIAFLSSNVYWPELLPFLHECVTSNSNRLKESFFLIFPRLALDICRAVVPDIMILCPLLRRTMNDDTLNLELRIETLSATITFIQCLSNLNEVKRVHSLLPAMLRTLTDTLSNDVAAQKVLKHFTKLAKNEPRFFRAHIVDAVNTMLEIAEDLNLKEKTKHLALEFVLTLVEAREKAPGMMRKLPLFANNYFTLLLTLLLDIKDEPSWHSAEDYLDEAGETENYKFCLVCLERFSNALGGKTVAPIAVEQLSPYLLAPEWEKRHAALNAITFIAKGCSKVLIKYSKRVVSMVLHCFQHPHARVRCAAIQSIGQLSIDLSPDFQEQHHNQVLPALVAVMDDFQSPRMQALAIVAVSNYFGGCENPETLVPYLDVILNKLLVLLQNDIQMLQQEAIDAFGAVAESSKEHFRKYYGFIMPHLKTILVNANDKSNHMLRSKALWCISMVGMAVGIEKFRDDVTQVVEMLKSSQESLVEEFGTISNILKAWTRICECMRKNFSPYMSTVMPLLVKCVQLQPDFIIDELNDSIHKVKFGDEMIHTKRSHVLEVKSLACSLLGLYAHILEEDFYPWIPQATSIAIPLLKYYTHNEVRKFASGALYMILESAKLAVEKGTAQAENESYFKQLSCDVISALGDALKSERETKVCARMLLALSICIQICGPLVTEDMLRTIMDAVKHVIKESSHRKEELTEREKSEDFDAEEAEFLRDEIEQEEEVSRSIGDILFSLVLDIKDAFLPFLDEIPSYLMPIRASDKTAEERITCINIFHGLVAQCGEAVIKYRNIYPFLLESSNDENPRVRERALYGLGLCALGYSVFKPFVGEALLRINEVTTHLHAHAPENESAYENAVYALGNICQFHRESINSVQIIPAWLNCLPLKGNRVLVEEVHDQLCSMVERSDKKLFGPKYEHFPKILSVFAEGLCGGKDPATEETKRMIIVLRNLQKTIPSAVWLSAWSLLLPQQEMELESVLSRNWNPFYHLSPFRENKKDTVQSFKTAITVSGVIVVLAGVVFVITKKLKERSTL